MTFDADKLIERIQKFFIGRGPRDCKCCGQSWEPLSWNFYDLCESCFEIFDKQKMKHRLTGEPGFEDVYKWLEIYEQGH